MNAFSASTRYVYDAFNMIHDVIKTANNVTFPYTAKFMCCRS